MRDVLIKVINPKTPNKMPEDNLMASMEFSMTSFAW